MKDLLETLKKGGILVCDGAMGTSLQAAGLEPGHAPEEWNIFKPGEVKKVHKSFIDAGCDMIITNTFGANPVKLKRAGLDARFTEVNTIAAALAKEAANDSVYVLGDIGPTGEFLKPLGGYEYEEFYDGFFKQATILYKGGVDAFIIETMSGLDELKAAVSGCKAVCNIPVIASMTFIQTGKGYRTMMGVSVQQAVGEILAMGCKILGANCGCGSQQMVEIMREFRDTFEKTANNDVFLIAQPNAGMPKLVKGKTVFDESASRFGQAIPELVKLGVSIIGGCCGTTPEHIKEIARIVKG